MKRILCALLSALLLLTLTACGGKKPAEDPSVQPPVEQPDPPDSPAPSEAEQSLADLRETIRAAGAVLGCAYLGATYGNDALDLHALLEDNGYAARYTVSGGAEITAREDRFTHTTEVRTPIKTESDDHDSGPSFSGGTTVNSGGFSHSGGKF